MRALVFLILFISNFAVADELVARRERLLALENTEQSLKNEIVELERLSAHRARNIKLLKVKITETKQRIEQREEEAKKIRAKAETIENAEAALNEQLAASAAKLKTVDQELAKISADYSKAESRHKSRMAQIETEKQEELKRRTDLNRRVANFENFLRTRSAQREVAEVQVRDISRGNEKLYEKLKGPSAAPNPTPPSPHTDVLETVADE